uniref:Peroxisomal biogenesis factor 11 gamma n=1 Tax=Sinocyclocheilus rhinocerous TaxID=307959 RepID=A0A673LCY5_9TELE
ENDSFENIVEIVNMSGDIIMDCNDLYCLFTRCIAPRKHKICDRRNDKQQALLYTGQKTRFDDLSMLTYSTSYGLGASVRTQDGSHIAWAADAELIKTKSYRWWVLSTGLWGLSLILNILGSIRSILFLKRKAQTCQRSGSAETALRRQIRGEVFSILSSLADLGNAIHWMLPGFLWAGRFPPWLVGLMGTTSSLIGLLPISSGDQGLANLQISSQTYWLLLIKC